GRPRNFENTLFADMAAPAHWPMVQFGRNSVGPRLLGNLSGMGEALDWRSSCPRKAACISISIGRKSGSTKWMPFWTFGKQVKHQQTTFQDAAAAQLKAWRDAAEKIQSAAANLAADRRPDVDAVLKRMKADASEAEANLQKLTRAGTESWTAMNGALAESRAAFDRANQSAWDAFKRAANPRA